MTNTEWEELVTYAINFVLDKTKTEIGGDANNDAAVERLTQRYLEESHHTEGYRATFRRSVLDLILHAPN